MNSQQIQAFFPNTPLFYGVFSCDTIPNTTDKCGMIINTDPKDNTGEHWVALFQNGKGSSEYFDSFGLPPIIPSILNHLTQTTPNGCKYNSLTLQHPSVSTCGLYCISFIRHKLLLNGSYESFLSYFCTNTIHNESIITRLFE